MKSENEMSFHASAPLKTKLIYCMSGAHLLVFHSCLETEHSLSLTFIASATDRVENIILPCKVIRLSHGGK